MINIYLSFLATVSIAALIWAFLTRPLFDLGLVKTKVSYHPIAVLIAVFSIGILLVKSYYFELINVPSKSMLPNLPVGTSLVMKRSELQDVNKLGSSSKPGDIMVFKFPGNTDVLYIKRVVGRPGDTVSLNKFGLTINDELSAFLPVEGVDNTFDVAVGEATWRVIIDPEKPFIDVVDYEVPNDGLFVLGDNLTSSGDSRHYGALNFSYIAGTVL